MPHRFYAQRRCTIRTNAPRGTLPRPRTVHVASNKRLRPFCGSARNVPTVRSLALATHLVAPHSSSCPIQRGSRTLDKAVPQPWISSRVHDIRTRQKHDSSRASREIPASRVWVSQGIALANYRMAPTDPEKECHKIYDSGLCCFLPKKRMSSPELTKNTFIEAGKLNKQGILPDKNKSLQSGALVSLNPVELKVDRKQNRPGQKPGLRL
jgi:hypothetical protein